MAVTLETLELKFKSEAAAAASKDVAALQRVDEQVRRAQQSLEKLEGAAQKASAARVAAEEKVAAAQSRLSSAQGGFGGSASIAAVRSAQQGLALAQKNAAAARERETGARSAAQAQAEENARIIEGRGGLEALAKARGRAAQVAARERQLLAEQSQNLKRSQDDATARTELQRAASERARSAGLEMAQAYEGAVAAMAKAGIVVVAALVAATAAVLAFAFDAATAARNTRILGLALTRTEAGGQEFADIIRQLAAEVPLAKDQIGALAAEMSRARLAGRDLQAGVTAVTIVTSALGDSAGGTIKSLIEASAAARRFSLGVRDITGEFAGLAGTGLKSADVLAALAKEMNTSVPAVEQALRAGRITVSQGVRALEAAARGRFGKVIELQMLDATTQFNKARESAASIFDDVDLEPALKSLREVLSVLDQTTTTGATVRAILKATFQTVADAAGNAGPILKKVFQGFLIGALLAYIAGKRVASILAPIGKALDIDGLQVGVYAGIALFVLLGGAAGAVAIAMTLAFLPLIIVFGILAGAVYLAYRAFKFLEGIVGAAIDALGGIDLSSVGTSIVDGLIAGITAGGARLLASVTNLGTSAANAFKASLGIASPSTVFAGFGMQLPAGAAVGVDAGASDLTGAVEDMAVEAEGVAPGAGPNAAPGGATGGTSFTWNGDAYFNGQKDPDLRATVEEGMLAAFRRWQAEFGAGRVPV